MITIGLIDDNEYEVDDIRATIMTTWKKSLEMPHEVDFKLYKLVPEPNLKEQLKEELIYDVENQVIQSLIVDYKLDSLRRVIEGKDVVEYLREKVPAFPVIILTNAPDRSKREDTIDPDKVYDKESFFALENEQSKEMAFKIYRNIERYIKRRSELEINLAAALDKLHEPKDPDVEVEMLAKIAGIEDELGDYTLTGQTTAEKAFDLKELHGLIGDLMALEEKLE